MRVPLPIPVLALALAASWPTPARAAWPTDPALNVPVCVTAGGVNEVSIVSDGAGGTIVGWLDWRGGHPAVFVQRVDANGVPLWATNGVPISDTSFTAWAPAFTADNAGGVIAAWFDQRNGRPGDVYAQRVGPAGSPQWAAGGVPVALGPGTGASLTIVSDGAGGAVCAWWNNQTTTYRNYAQRMNASGATLWAASAGVPLTSRSTGLGLQVVADGSGGIIGTWYDGPSPTQNTFAQRLDGTGVVRWSDDGIAMGAAGTARTRPAIASDGSGGAIVAWDDHRLGANLPQIYAQRFDPNGMPLWTGGGVPLAATGTMQWGDTLLADGHGGVFAVFVDTRGGFTSPLYAQHLGAAGQPLWTTVAVAVDSISSNPIQPVLASDGNDGMVVAWVAFVGGASDIRAQSFTAAGTRRWATPGATVCSAPGYQYNPVIVGDGNGGLTAAWWDGRVVPALGSRTYAQYVGPGGLPGTASATAALAPMALALASPWPSPVRAGAEVTLSVTLPADGGMRAAIYDTEGRLVRTLAGGSLRAGPSLLRWDTRDERARTVGAGVYFVRVQAAGRTASRRMVITR